MGQSTQERRASASRHRVELLERLTARRDEIEQTVLTRVYSVQDPGEGGDPTYVAGLRAAVSAALRYGFSGIEERRADPAPIPGEMLSQVRYAAGGGVSLDTVLRRYFAGYTLLNDFIMQEAEKGDLFGVEDLQNLCKAQAILFDHLINEISEEYQRNAETNLSALSLEKRRAACVLRLLDGCLADVSNLDYDFDLWHIGVIGTGPERVEAMRSFAKALDHRLLLVARDESVVWAWLGGRQQVDREELTSHMSMDQYPQALLAIGQSAQGLSGWRLTHHQAAAASPVAFQDSRNIVFYADVALLASMRQDEVLVKSLHDLYLAPLAMERDGGETFRKTLRAYFDAGHNVSSAASALKVNRHTVSNRLHMIEERLGRPLNTCAAEVDAALRLLALDPDPLGNRFASASH